MILSDLARGTQDFFATFKTIEGFSKRSDWLSLVLSRALKSQGAMATPRHSQQSQSTPSKYTTMPYERNKHDPVKQRILWISSLLQRRGLQRLSRILSIHDETLQGRYYIRSLNRTDVIREEEDDLHD